MGARSRDPLRARAAERDRRHPSPLHDDARRNRHSRRAHAGGRAAGDHGARRDCRDPRRHRGHDPARPRRRWADHSLSRHLADLFRRALRHCRRGRAALQARRGGERAGPHCLALASTLAAPAVGHHNAATTSRWFAVGNAAGNGLNAAVAAQQGFTSDRKLLEGRVLPDVLGVTPDLAALTDGLGERIALTEVSFKPWCAARQTMAATQALKDIVASGVAPAAIDAIAVSVPPPHLKMTDHGVVAGDRASHLTSLQYTMALAALAPEMAFDVQQTPPDLPLTVRGLMAKIRVEADERLLVDYPMSWPARVRVAAG